MKFDFKEVLLETKIASYWGNVGDTILGHIDLEEFKKRMTGTNPSKLARKMVRNGLVQAAGFPPSIQCPKMIVECAKHYKFDERKIIGHQGRIMANFIEEPIAEVFDIPSHSKLTVFTLEVATNFYMDNLDKALEIINTKWINKPRQHFSKLPKVLHRSDFYDEYGDMITLLSRVVIGKGYLV